MYHLTFPSFFFCKLSFLLMKVESFLSLVATMQSLVRDSTNLEKKLCMSAVFHHIVKSVIIIFSSGWCWSWTCCPFRCFCMYWYNWTAMYDHQTLGMLCYVALLLLGCNMTGSAMFLVDTSWINIRWGGGKTYKCLQTSENWRSSWLYVTVICLHVFCE